MVRTKPPPQFVPILPTPPIFCNKKTPNLYQFTKNTPIHFFYHKNPICTIPPPPRAPSWLHFLPKNTPPLFLPKKKPHLYHFFLPKTPAICTFFSPKKSPICTIVFYRKTKWGTFLVRFGVLFGKVWAFLW